MGILVSHGEEVAHAEANGIYAARNAFNQGYQEGLDHGLKVGEHNGKASQWKSEKNIIGSLMNHLHARTMQRDVLLQELARLNPNHPYVSTEISQHPELVKIMEKNRMELSSETGLRDNANGTVAILEAAGASMTAITKGEEAMAADGVAFIANQPLIQAQDAIVRAHDEAIHKYVPYPPFVKAAEEFPNYLWAALQQPYETPEDDVVSPLQKILTLGLITAFSGPITDGLGETVSQREANRKEAAAYLLETYGGYRVVDKLNALTKENQQPENSMIWIEQYAKELVDAYVEAAKRKYKSKEHAPEQVEEHPV